MIRLGKYEDVASIVAMAGEFWQHTIYDEPLNHDIISRRAESCIDNKLMAVLEIEGKVCGFACGVMGGLLANDDVIAGTELAWWIDADHRQSGYGVELLKFIEELARNAGIKYWNMVYMLSSMPKVVKEIYKSLGYQKTEVVYSKVLT